MYTDGPGEAAQDVTDTFDGGAEGTGGTGYKPISGSSWVFSEVQWTGMHNFSVGGNDRSVVQGTWSFDLGSGTTMTGMFYGQTANAITSASDILPGDLVITKAKSDNPDEIQIVALSDIPGSIDITFTDNGWQSSGSFRSNEGSFTYTTPGGGMSKGTAVNPGVSGVALSGSGDQILAYTGTSGDPRFIHAFHYDSTDFGDATNSNTTALPIGLVDGISAINFSPERDNNYLSNTSITGSRSQVLRQLNLLTNYTQDDSNYSSTLVNVTVND